MSEETNVSEGTWVVEWDEREDEFYFWGLRDFLDRNQTCFFEGARGGGYPLAFVESETAASEIARIFREERDGMRNSPFPTDNVRGFVEDTRELIRNTLEVLGEYYAAA